MHKEIRYHLLNDCTSEIIEFLPGTNNFFYIELTLL